MPTIYPQGITKANLPTPIILPASDNNGVVTKPPTIAPTKLQSKPKITIAIAICVIMFVVV